MKMVDLIKNFGNPFFGMLSNLFHQGRYPSFFDILPHRLTSPYPDYFPIIFLGDL